MSEVGSHVKLRRFAAWHRAIAVVLVGFAGAHLANHALAVRSADLHVQVMHSLRDVYRHPSVEPLLLTAVGLQVALGLVMLWRGRTSRKQGWERVQALSGGYLAFFLVQHVSAALYTRLVVGRETDVFWAASVVQRVPLAYYYVPYYLLAPLALFSHLAAAAHCSWRERRPALALWASASLIGVGTTLAVASVAGLWMAR